MLKIGLPRAAVEHKMQAEGLDPAILDSDSNIQAAPPPTPKPMTELEKKIKDAEDRLKEAEDRVNGQIWVGLGAGLGFGFECMRDKESSTELVHAPCSRSTLHDSHLSIYSPKKQPK